MDYSIPSRGSSNTPSWLHATETRISSSSVSHCGPSAALPFLPICMYICTVGVGFNSVLKVIQDCFGFALLHSMIGFKDLCHPLNPSSLCRRRTQPPVMSWRLILSATQAKPIMTDAIYQNQSRLGHARFPGFGTSYMHLV